MASPSPSPSHPRPRHKSYGIQLPGSRPFPYVASEQDMDCQRWGTGQACSLPLEVAASTLQVVQPPGCRLPLACLRWTSQQTSAAFQGSSCSAPPHKTLPGPGLSLGTGAAWKTGLTQEGVEAADDFHIVEGFQDGGTVVGELGLWVRQAEEGEAYGVGGAHRGPRGGAEVRRAMNTSLVKGHASCPLSTLSLR